MRLYQDVICNNRGISLVGVLAAAGILSVIIVGGMTVANNMMQTLRTADVKADIQSEIFLAQALLATESNCTVNFKGLAIDEKSRKFDAHGGKLFLSTKPGVYTLGKSPIFASQSSKTSNAILKSMDYKLYPGSENVMVLSLEFQPRGSILGGSIRDRELPVQVRLKNGKIESCVALGTPLPPTFEDEDAEPQRGQGTGCSSSPPGGMDKASAQALVKSLCAKQKYPVKEGLSIPSKEMQKCSGSVNDSKQCKNLLAFAYLEGGKELSFIELGLGRGKDVILKSRNSYASEKECLKQQLFSEGDSYMFPFTPGVVTGPTRMVENRSNDTSRESTPTRPLNYVCINGRWIEN